MPQLLLTDISVRSLKGSNRNEKFFDTKTPGFGIRCGLRTKTWVVMRGRKRELVTIGRYPDISLADARTEAKRLLSNEPETKVASIKFEKARATFIEENYKGRSPYTKYQVKRSLELHFAELDNKVVSAIDDSEIKEALDKIEKPSERLHAFRYLRTFLRWCLKPPRRYLKHSPMEGYDPPGRDTKGTRTLTDPELKAVWNASKTGTKRIFQLIMLWGTRAGESTRLERKWAKDAILTIPGFQNGERVTKNGRALPIPLTPLAKGILDEIPDTGRYYFPGKKDGTHVRSTSLTKLRREVQEDSGTSGWTTHDLRRTFRSNCSRIGIPREICEALINHAPDALEEIYDHYDKLPERFDALARYEAFMIKLLSPGN